MTRFALKPKAQLRQWYVDERMHPEDIAKLLGCTMHQVEQALRKHHIHRPEDDRNYNERKRLQDLAKRKLEEVKNSANSKNTK